MEACGSLWVQCQPFLQRSSKTLSNATQRRPVPKKRKKKGRPGNLIPALEREMQVDIWVWGTLVYTVSVSQPGLHRETNSCVKKEKKRKKRKERAGYWAHSVISFYDFWCPVFISNPRACLLLLLFSMHSSAGLEFIRLDWPWTPRDLQASASWVVRLSTSASMLILRVCL